MTIAATVARLDLRLNSSDKSSYGEISKQAVILSA